MEKLWFRFNLGKPYSVESKWHLNRGYDPTTPGGRSSVCGKRVNMNLVTLERLATQPPVDDADVCLHCLRKHEILQREA